MQNKFKQVNSESNHFKSEEITPAFSEFLGELSRRLEAGDPALVARFIREAKISPADIAPFKLFSDERYQRNLVARTDAYELLILCWRSGQLSPLHNHKGSACYVRTFEGSATEVRFERAECGVLVPSGLSTLECGNVTASFDEDTHLIANFRSEELVTMHCYAPPLLKPEIFPVEDSFIPSLQKAYLYPIEAETYVTREAVQ